MDGAQRVIGEHAGQVAQFAAGESGRQIAIRAKRAGRHHDALGLAQGVGLQGDLEFTPGLRGDGHGTVADQGSAQARLGGLETDGKSPLAICLCRPRWRGDVAHFRLG